MPNWEGECPEGKGGNDGRKGEKRRTDGRSSVATCVEGKSEASKEDEANG